MNKWNKIQRNEDNCKKINEIIYEKYTNEIKMQTRIVYKQKT